MRRTGRLWPAAVIAVLAWPAIHWLFWPGYLSTYDGIYHLTRMVEVDTLVRQGILYPRWFADFGQGHGYPIFTFFPPFGYLLTELPALLLGDLPLAIQVSMAASMLVSGWGMYLLARELAAGRLAAVAVAAFYVYFPYHVQDVYTRGGMPELWAMAWLPWLVWAQIRATRNPSVMGIAIAGLLGAIQIGTHNILAVFILPASLAMSLAFAPLKGRFVLASLACSGLGVLLATGYWLPAIAEAPLTRVRQLAGDWLPNHTFEISQLVDWRFFTPYGDQTYKLTALEAAVVVLLLALLLWRGAKARRRLPEIGLVGLMLALLFLLTRWSVPFWLNVPLMGCLQFPWRLLILVGFVAAVMLVLAGSWHRWAWTALAALAVVTAVSSLGQVPDSRFAPAGPFDARTLERQEYGSALDGVAIESEYQPRTSSPDLVKASQGKRLPGDDTSAPPLTIQELAIRPDGIRAAVTASEPTRLRLQALYFPGWQARLDASAWPIRPATPAGLIEADVPPGNHTLEVAYRGTGVELAGGLISGFTVLVLAAWLLRRRPLALAAAVLVVAGVSALLWRPPVPHTAILQTGSQLSADQTVVGMSSPRATTRGIELDLFWLYHAPREAPFDFVLRNAADEEVRRTPASQATTMPYEYVAANELLRRHYTLTGSLGLPGGSYMVSLEAPGTAAPLGAVVLSGGEQAAHQVNVPFQDGATLASYSVHRVKKQPGLSFDDLSGRADGTAYPGDFLLVRLLWHSQHAIDQNYVTFVHLLDASGKSWASHDNQPNATLQATGSWVPGQNVPDQFLLRLPEEMPPGVYRLEAGLYHIGERGYQFLPLANGGNSVLFGSVKVRPRTPAPSASPIARWSEGIALLGWRQGPDLALTFDWAAAGEPPRDYTLFVHLSDGSAKVVTQADSSPQGGAFPTSVWEAGDRVSDTHVVRGAPAGQWRLSIGWYDAATGQRLPLASGGDELDLGDIQVPGAAVSS
ncbi:MAG TPA: 6-pyruvoyl-tetrahydropterin synthase-related protein [Chloroflexota bacterium]|nr:6-pyruvoyl-tetrahydropterin synthase-related protein [Chloroflexota bacterium]